MGSSDETNYSRFFRQLVTSLSASKDSDGSNSKNGSLQSSNDNHKQNQGLSPIIPLQTRKENPVVPKNLNSFEREQSLLQNSATQMFLGLSNSVNLLQNSVENPSNLQNLSNSKPEQSLLQNSAKQLHAGSDINVNQLQTPAEKLGFAQILNNFSSKPSYSVSDSANHFSSHGQLLTNNVTENLSGSNVSNKLPSEQLLERPTENPKEDDPPTQTTSEAIDEIFPQKDDYSLLFVFQEGLSYCAMVNKGEETTSNSIKEEDSTTGLLMVQPSNSEAMNRRVNGSMKIIDLLEQNLPKSTSKSTKLSGEIISQPKGKLQVGSSIPLGSKENIPTYNKTTPSLLAAALINRSDRYRSGRLNTTIPSSASPPSIIRGNGGPLRSRARTFPVKFHGDNPGASSSYKGFNWNIKPGSISSGTPLYHGASRLSRSISALESNSNWQTIPTRYNPEAETQKWQNNFVGSSDVKGVGDKQFSSTFSGLNNQSFSTSPSSLSVLKKETAMHVPLGATEIAAKILNSASQSQINGSGQNQQLEQLLSVLQVPAQQSPEKLDFTKPLPHQNYSISSFSQGCNILPMSSVNRSFFHEGQKSDYGVNGSSNQAIPGGNSSKGNMVNSKLIGAPLTFYCRECQNKVVDPALENVGAKIETTNLASVNLGEKEFESMVNWPEHHLMGTDRFGFDV